MTVPSTDGHEVVVNLVTKGDIFGDIALLDGRPPTTEAVAISDCEMFVIERRDFLPLVREEPEIALKLIEIVCGRLRQTTQQVESMFLHLPGRLAKALLRLSSGGGVELVMSSSIMSPIAGRYMGATAPRISGYPRFNASCRGVLAITCFLRLAPCQLPPAALPEMSCRVPSNGQDVTRPYPQAALTTPVHAMNPFQEQSSPVQSP
jgi:hypothetical protein